MFREKTRLYKVYHIHEVGNRNIQEGYVGVTRRSLSYRLSQHMCSKRRVGTILRQLGKDNIQIDLIAMLPKEEALSLINTKESQAIADEVADKAITLVKDKQKDI